MYALCFLAFIPSSSYCRSSLLLEYRQFPLASTTLSVSHSRSLNDYDQRRGATLAQFVNARFKAAAAASAITLVLARLKPGDSTDGAVFFENRTKEKSLGAGRFMA